MAFLSGLYTKEDSQAIQKNKFLGCENFTDGYRQDVNHVVYESAVIALAVRLAKVDGEVSGKEIDAFSRIFGIYDNELRNVRDYFFELQDDYLSTTHYVKRIMRFFPHERKMYTRLVSRLFSFAIEDAPINAEEIIVLKQIADAFELSHEFFLQKLRLYMMPPSGNAYQILGISSDASADEVHYAYQKAVRACHPDRLVFLEPSADITVIANTRINMLATAYYVIKKHNHDLLEVSE